jgi:hypothetical protein
MRSDDLKVLGLSNDCSADEIRRAFRKLALRYHPDISSNPEDHHQFLLIQSAYQRLLVSEEQSRSLAESSVSWRDHNPIRNVTTEPKRLSTAHKIFRYLYTPPLFVLILLLTPIFIMLIPIIPRLMERAERNRRKH